MSDNHIKEPGSLSDLLSSPTDRDASKKNSVSGSESGWRNYPENIDMQEDTNQTPSDEQTEAILQQLIAENASSDPATAADLEQAEPSQIDSAPDTPERDSLNDLIEKVNQQQETQHPQAHQLPSSQSQQQLQPQAAHPVQSEQPTAYPVPGAHPYYSSTEQQQYQDYPDDLPQPTEFTQQQVPVMAQVHHPAPIENTSAPAEKEQLQVEALERWLEKPVPEKENSSAFTVVLYTLACLMVVFLAYTGVYITGNYPSFGAPLTQVSSLFVGDPAKSPKQETEPFRQVSTGTPKLPPNFSEQPKQPIKKTRSFEVNTNSPSAVVPVKSGNSFPDNNNKNSEFGSNNNNNNDNSNSVKLASAAPLVATPALKSNTQDCPLPTTKLSPIPGGFTAMNISSSCRSEQLVDISYGGISFRTRFDQRGNLNYLLDCFVGDRQPITIRYQDGKQEVKTPVLQDMGSITKVALIWESEHNLNLHALEYAAPQGSENHVWEKNPLTIENASQKLEANGTGHGFMSSSSGFSKGSTSKIEVYTFLHSPDEFKRPGVIKLAINYAVKQSNIQQIACNSSEISYVNYKSIQLKQNGSMTTQQGQLAINPCNVSAANSLLVKKAIKDLQTGIR